MGIITRIEEKIGNLVEMPFQHGQYLDLIRIEIALKRLMEGRRKPVFDRTYVYPCYTIILDHLCFVENEPFLNRFEELLKSNIQFWLKEKGYETIHPIAISFQGGAPNNGLFEIAISKKSWSSQSFLLDVRSGSRFALHPPVTVIGRGEDCHIHLADEAVSQRHAQIIFERGKHVLTDLCSRNGTRVNQQKVSAICLQDRDEIYFGGIKCIFRIVGG
jgi:hypothetical protein